MPATVTVTSNPESKFAQQIQTGAHNLLGDEPATAGGANLGPTPYEFLLAALGT